MSKPSISVTSVGVVTALGVGADGLFRGLLAGQRAICPVAGFGVEGCRATLSAEVSCALPSDCDSRTAALSVVALSDALKGLPGLGDLRRVGLVFGSAGAGTAVLEGHLAGDVTAAALLKHYTKRRVVDELSMRFGLAGPLHAINTACSSGAVAVSIAVDWLQYGECDVAIALAADELGRFTFTGFHALRAMDPEPCRPFDRNRRGLTMGEGAGCLILERADDAKRRGCTNRGYVRSVGLACDAHHLTAPDPEGLGPARALTRAIESGGIQPEDVGFINAHGTGTQLNDAAEVASIERALSAHAPRCPIHSVKSSIGHCMGAAGAIEAVVTLCSLEQQLVPPTAGLVDCEFSERVTCVKDYPMRVQADYALSNSFGFGGNDAAILFAHSRTAGNAHP